MKDRYLGIIESIPLKPAHHDKSRFQAILLAGYFIVIENEMTV